MAGIFLSILIFVTRYLIALTHGVIAQSVVALFFQE